MVRPTPSPAQNFLSSVILPCASILLLPVSLLAVAACVTSDWLFGKKATRVVGGSKGCVIVSGGRMSKGLALARAFKRDGWTVIGVEEEGWGDLCPMRFSSSIDHFYLLPSPSLSFARYSTKLISIAKTHSADLFIPISGAGSSIEDSRAADAMFAETKQRCRTFIQDPETMEDLHDKDKFINLVDRLGIPVPKGRMVTSLDEAMGFLRSQPTSEPTFVFKCMELDENRGDMTLYPLRGDTEKLEKTKSALASLNMPITPQCPYVFQEFIPGQEYCTHASVINGHITSFVTCPSNDMLMTYANVTQDDIGRQAEEWTSTFLALLQTDPTTTGNRRRLTGHFSFDLIQSTKDGILYPIECNARVHTAVILLPLDGIASCYSETTSSNILRPPPGLAPRSWLYNDLIMRYLPRLLPSHHILELLHPSLPACLPGDERHRILPSDDPWRWRVDPTLVADDWIPFLVLWQVWWPSILLKRWWEGKKWTRLNVSTGRIFEC